MYSTDFRSRVSSYDRRRSDQERVTSLLSRSRDAKRKLKVGEYPQSKSARTSTNSLIRSSQQLPVKMNYLLESHDADIRQHTGISIDPAIFSYEIS